VIFCHTYFGEFVSGTNRCHFVLAVDVILEIEGVIIVVNA